MGHWSPGHQGPVIRRPGDLGHMVTVHSGNLRGTRQIFTKKLKQAVLCFHVQVDRNLENFIPQERPLEPSGILENMWEVSA